jgi:hypothetical protein
LAFFSVFAAGQPAESDLPNDAATPNGPPPPDAVPEAKPAAQMRPPDPRPPAESHSAPKRPTRGLADGTAAPVRKRQKRSTGR